MFEVCFFTAQTEFRRLAYFWLEGHTLFESYPGVLLHFVGTKWKEILRTGFRLVGRNDGKVLLDLKPFDKLPEYHTVRGKAGNKFWSDREG